MSEYETIKNELNELKGLVKQLINKEYIKPEWISANEACAMMNIKKSTLNSYRHRRLIEFRKPRPYQYSVKSIEKFMSERTIHKVI